MTRPRQRDIQGVEFFALALKTLGLQRGQGAGGGLAFADQKHKLGRVLGLARPVNQHAHGVGVALGGVGVEQQHGVRLQALGAVDGEQAHGQWVHGGGRQHATAFEGAHKGVGRGVAPTAQLQGHGQQGAQVGQHRVALAGRRHAGKARQHVAIGVNGLQRVMRRQLVQPRLPLKKNGT